MNAAHVAYKSAAPGVLDLIGGRVDMMIVSMPTALVQFKAQRLRAIAVASPNRSSLMPDVPTAEESGVPGYEVTTWWGMLAPAGVSPTVIAKISEAVVKNFRRPDMKEALARDGADVIGSTPAEFGAFMRKESAKWEKVIKTSNIKVE